MSGVFGAVRQFARGSLGALLCALTAHATAYRSLVPDDGLHGYLGLYEAVVFGLSALALATILLAVVAAATGRDGRWRDRVRCPAGGSSRRSSALLALGALVLLLVQESLERSLVSGAPAWPEPDAQMWLVAVAAAFGAALVLRLLRRSCVSLLRAVHARDRLRRRRPTVARPRRAQIAVGRRNALANRRGLRAPPALAG
jgi:hypothetical protein